MKNVMTIVVIVIILFFVGYNLWKSDDVKYAPIPKEQTQPEISSNPYVVKYAGGYTVRVLTVETPGVAEVYVLHKSGKAKWMWIESDVYGNAETKSEKTGTWTAEKNKISISIQGNSGIIKEEFVMWRGMFIDKDTQRFLKRKE